MKTTSLTIENINKLNNIRSKLSSKKDLLDEERIDLISFLNGLPSTTNLLSERFPLNEEFELELFSVEEMRPHTQKWLRLFNQLPLEISKLHIHAIFIDQASDNSFWKRKVVIEAIFTPSKACSYLKKEENSCIGLNLKADGTAYFEFLSLKLAQTYPDLYNFNGTWKEAYLAVMKTLREGWPQIKFPHEFEPFLKE